MDLQRFFRGRPLAAKHDVFSKQLPGNGQRMPGEELRRQDQSLIRCVRCHWSSLGSSNVAEQARSALPFAVSDIIEDRGRGLKSRSPGSRGAQRIEFPRQRFAKCESAIFRELAQDFSRGGETIAARRRQLAGRLLCSLGLLIRRIGAACGASDDRGGIHSGRRVGKAEPLWIAIRKFACGARRIIRGIEPGVNVEIFRRDGVSRSCRGIFHVFDDRLLLALEPGRQIALRIAIGRS